MRIYLNSRLFEYDIRGLLQAFFPWEKFLTEEVPGEDALAVRFFREDGDPREILVEDRGIFRAEISFLYQGIERNGAVIFDRSDPMAKTRVKQTVYRILCDATKKTMPWGTLTGIRPTKLIREMIEDGKSEEEIRAHLTRDLLVSNEKADLGLEVAVREESLIKTLEKDDGYSLYVGVPFCPSTCLYCSFASVTIGAYRKKVAAYLQAVAEELRYIAAKFSGRKLHTVYFGGGTPTSLEADELGFLLSETERLFPVRDALEWTVEAGRPDSITPEKLKVMQKYPVTRISVNPQTMHQETLDLVGRRHTVDDVRNAFRLAREAGFDNINMDLILGLPNETEEQIASSIAEVIEMGPESVTLHALAVKRSSRLNLEKDVYQACKMELSDDLMRRSIESLKDAGLDPYYLYRQKNMAGNLENVGFSRPGKECYYNMVIMEETEDILSAGAGAMTKHVAGTRVTRAANPHNVDVYLENLPDMIRRKEELLRT